MSDIAIIGEKEVIFGFSLVGFKLFPANNFVEAKNALEECSKENCRIIFITENIAQLVIDEIEKTQIISPNSICILPNRTGSSELSIKMLRKNVEKAVGTDILFRKEER